MDPRRLVSAWCLVAIACGGSDSNPAQSVADGGFSDRDAEVSDAGVGPDPMEARLAVWTEIRDRLRASPAHRAAEAQRVASSGDPAEMFAFVRDRIAVTIDNVGRFETDMRWGIDAAIRSGLGTPREKIEMLRRFLASAGFETEVRWGFVAPDRAEDLRAPFFAPLPDEPPLTFADEDVARWRARLGQPIEDMFEVVDRDLVQSRQLAAQLRPQVPDPSQPFALNISTVRMPFLRYRRAGGPWTDANPVVRGAELGTSYAGNEGSLADPPDAIEETIAVRVWARKNVGVDRAEPEDLVEASWSIEQSVGRTATVQFSPLLDHRDLLIQSVRDLSLFLPSISLAGPGDRTEDVASRSAVGGLISRATDTYRMDGDRVTINGRVLSNDLGPTSTAADRVRSIVARADALGFPTVRLVFEAFDDRGEPVEGLLGGDVSVTEDGRPVIAAVRANQYRPRIIFAIDRSLSVPGEIRDGYVQLVTELAAPLFADHDAEVMVTALGPFDDNNPFVTNVPALQSQIENDVAGGGSDLWTELAQLSRIPATAVIVISDMDNPDEALTPELTSAIRTGPPFLLVGVGTVNQDTVAATLALNPRSSYAEAQNIAGAARAIDGFIEARQANYELVYTAPAGDATTRTAQINLRDQTVTASAAYTIASATTDRRGYVGLYLTLTYDGRTRTRTLAGIPPDADVDEATPADYADVQGAFLGKYAVRMEAGWPSVTQFMDDILTERLDNEAVFRAWNDFEAMTAAMDNGLRITPVAPGTLLWARPPSDPASRTEPTGLRAVLHTQRPRLDRGTVERSMDILPLGPWRTVHADPLTAWNLTFERSLHLAVLEASYYQDSTISQLAGEALETIPAEAAAQSITDPQLAERWRRATLPYRFDYIALLPVDRDPVAFYAVHERTGFVVGVLDKVGGGTRGEEARAELEREIRVFEMLESLLGLAGIDLGFWVKLEIAKAKVVAYATLAILTLETWDPSTAAEWSPEAVAEDEACGALEGAVTDRALSVLPGGLGGAISTIDSVVSLVLGSGPLPSFCD